jgi:ABC-type uncharacterized transport system substrate-binding protein
MKRILAVVVLFIMASVASAHPHVRFVYELEPILEAGRIAALRIAWRMDALTTMLVARGIDANRNGTVDADELEAFAAENRRLLAASGYFVQLNEEEKPIEFSIATPLRAELGEGGITLRFELRFTPVVPERLGVRFFDESWYVALSAAEPVLGGKAPCTASARTSLVATQGWGAQPVPTIAFTCNP